MLPGAKFNVLAMAVVQGRKAKPELTHGALVPHSVDVPMEFFRDLSMQLGVEEVGE